MNSTKPRFTPPQTSDIPPFTVGETENETGEHWVSRLFPPTYSDVDFGENSEEMKTILGNRLTALDPEALKKVFHRVHALLAEQKEIVEGGKTPEIPASVPVKEPTPKDTSLDESCIWDEGEINILRQSYKALRDEHRKLKIELDLTKKKLSKTTTDYSRTRDYCDQNAELLHEARQANARFQIMTETLKRDLNSTKAENAQMKDDLQALRMERLDLIDKVKNAQMESNKDRIEKKRLNLEVIESGKTMIEAAAHLESKLRVKYQQEINELNRTIEELRDELKQEKETHSATRRGLDHLRTHFASLPIEKGVEDKLAGLKFY